MLFSVSPTYSHLHGLPGVLHENYTVSRVFTGVIHGDSPGVTRCYICSIEYLFHRKSLHTNIPGDFPWVFGTDGAT